MSLPSNFPRISVVIATYNCKAYLLETVRSVVEQILPAHEIIVVDDGSGDGTAEAVRAAFPAVIVHVQKNFGKGVARNTGIAIATGDWIAFLDHDDLWHKDKLRHACDYLAAHPECEALNHPLWFFCSEPDAPAEAFGFKRDFHAKSLEECHAAALGRREGTSDAGYLKITGNSFRLLLERNRGALSASVVRREMVLRAGAFCPMQANGEDWTFFLNVARLTEWHTLPERLAFIRLHAGQDTHKPGSALMIMAGQVNAWYTGRPFPERLARREDVFREITVYAREYRRLMQSLLWGALKSGEFRTARQIMALGTLLLPRRRDRFYAMMPPPLTWRWERHMLGMHK